MKASKSNIKSRNRIGKAKYKKYNFEVKSYDILAATGSN